MLDPKLNLSQLIEDNQSLTQAVRRFEPIPYVTGQTIIEFCEKRQINLSFFLEILRVFDNPKDFDSKTFRTFPVPVILDYLKRTHYYYLNTRLYEIDQTVEQLLLHNQDTNPLVILLSGFFSQYRKELLQHILLEENQLFPYIEHLYHCQCNANHLALPQSKNYSLKAFEAVHDDNEEVKLSLVREKIILQNPATTETLSYKVLLSQLETLETDMHIHGLLEDKVLLPIAYELEQCQFN